MMAWLTYLGAHAEAPDKIDSTNALRDDLLRFLVVVFFGEFVVLHLDLFDDGYECFPLEPATRARQFLGFGNGQDGFIQHIAVLSSRLERCSRRALARSEPPSSCLIWRSENPMNFSVTICCKRRTSSGP